MLYPVYPELYRRLGRGTRNAGRVLGILSIISLLVLVAAFVCGSEKIFLLGFISAFVFISLYIVAGKAKEAFIYVRIGKDSICVVDEKGNNLRSTLYRYVRSMEVRTISLSLEGRDSGGSSYNACRGLNAKLIMVYFDGASCFEDLKLCGLKEFGGKDVFYWCDEVLFHHSCIAFSYNEEAWQLLQRTQKQPA